MRSLKCWQWVQITQALILPLKISSNVSSWDKKLNFYVPFFFIIIPPSDVGKSKSVNAFKLKRDFLVPQSKAINAVHFSLNILLPTVYLAN